MPRYIAIEGPIGSGKTTLAKNLASTLDYPSLLEPDLENPFLEKFYTQKSSELALPTQLFFLLHRIRQVSEIPTHDLLGPTLITDFLMEKDRIFAELNLNTEELKLYDQISKSLEIQSPPPDLVLYLQASVPTLQKRIQLRGFDFEQNIKDRYLEDLANRYTEYFHQYSASPLLIINTETIDFANNVGHFQSLINQILTMSGSRHFFNPNPLFL